MKKASTLKTNAKSLPKLSNNRVVQNDCEKNKTFCLNESNSMIESQAAYIENLQQQIFVLESEIGYLRSCMQESSKQRPCMVAEGEKMVKKLTESHNEIKTMKIDLKRKQTTIDLLRSEKDRTNRYKDELEENFRKEKRNLLEELITLKKERDSQQDKIVDLERLFMELKQNDRNLQEDLGNTHVEMEQIKKERTHDKEMICELLQSKENLQKELFEAKMIAESKASEKGVEAIKALKVRLEELTEVYEVSKRSADHERMLRERLSEDNNELIHRHAELEADLAEARAHLREEQSLRSSLEQIHLNVVVEASEAKSKDASFKEEINRLNALIKEECERSYNLTLQVAHEQRFKMHEEEKFVHLQQRFDQRETQFKARERENVDLLKENMYLKDQVLHLKQQLQNRDEEITTLKQKVQEMQVSVEEFIQSSQAANRIAGERWKQLGQLAQSIQTLTSISEHTA